MMSKRPATFSDNLPRPAPQTRLATVIGGPYMGRVDVQVAGGEIMRRVPLAGGAALGDTIRLDYVEGDYTAQGTRPGSGSASTTLVGAIGSGAGGGSAIPNPHDLLGANHTLPVLLPALVFASPAVGTGTPAFRTLQPNDLPGAFAGFANPTGLVKLTATNGASSYAMRADAAPALDQSIAPNWTGLHTFNAGAQSLNYVAGIRGWAITGDGDAEFNNILARGELRAFVFKINELSATAGTFGVFYSASTAWADFTTAASLAGSFTFRAKNSDAGGMLFGVGDICRVKAWNGSALVDAWFTITARTNETTRTLYTATLNSGSTNATIREGSAIVDYGPANTGAITLSTDGTVGSTPNMTMFTHAGSPWSTLTPLLRIGNLNGYGSLGAIYGVAIGDPTKAWAYWDSSAIRFRQGATDVIILDGAANSSYFAGLVTIDTSGEIRQGTGTVDVDFTGLRIRNSSGVGLIEGVAGNVQQWAGSTDGKFYMGQGFIRGEAAGLFVLGDYVPGYGSSGAAIIRPSGKIYLGGDTTTAPRMHGTTISNLAGTNYSGQVTIDLVGGGTAAGNIGTFVLDGGSGAMTWQGVSIAGTRGRNHFRDSERSDGLGLRVGVAWNKYGIYAETGECMVGGASGVLFQNSQAGVDTLGRFTRDGLAGGIYFPTVNVALYDSSGSTLVGASKGVGTYTIDMNHANNGGFGANVRAVAVRGSVSWTTAANTNFLLLKDGSNTYGVGRGIVANMYSDFFCIVPLNGSGDFTYEVGGATAEVFMYLCGYFY